MSDATGRPAGWLLDEVTTIGRENLMPSTSRATTRRRTPTREADDGGDGFLAQYLLVAT